MSNRRTWRAPGKASEGSGEHYLSISDLMSSLLAIFLLLVMVFMARSLSAEAKTEQDQKRIADLERELKQKVDARRIVLGQLKEALEARNIDVEINAETGDVSIREAVLFRVNSAELGKDGQAFIESFVPTYAKIIFGNQEFVASIHRIVIEGHTSSEGDEAKNLRLSLDRARAVAEHIQLRMAFPERAGLFQKLVAAGRGEADAVQESVDERDRKVMFRFEFTNEQFLASIRESGVLGGLERVQPTAGEP